MTFLECVTRVAIEAAVEPMESMGVKASRVSLL